MSIVDVDRAAFELRHGREVEIDGQIIIHPEFLTEKIWQNLATQNLKLLVTPLRAKAIFNQEFTASNWANVFVEQRQHRFGSGFITRF